MTFVCDSENITFPAQNDINIVLESWKNLQCVIDKAAMSLYNDLINADPVNSETKNEKKASRRTCLSCVCVCVCVFSLGNS